MLLRKAFRNALNQSFGESYLKYKEVCFKSERQWKEANIILKIINSPIEKPEDIHLETFLDLNQLYGYYQVWAKEINLTLHSDNIEIESSHGKRYIWHKR